MNDSTLNHLKYRVTAWTRTLGHGLLALFVSNGHYKLPEQLSSFQTTAGGMTAGCASMAPAALNTATRTLLIGPLAAGGLVALTSPLRRGTGYLSSLPVLDGIGAMAWNQWLSIGFFTALLAMVCRMRKSRASVLTAVRTKKRNAATRTIIGLKAFGGLVAVAFLCCGVIELTAGLVACLDGPTLRTAMDIKVLLMPKPVSVILLLVFYGGCYLLYYGYGTYHAFTDTNARWEGPQPTKGTIATAHHNTTPKQPEPRIAELSRVGYVFMLFLAAIILVECIGHMKLHGFSWPLFFHCLFSLVLAGGGLILAKVLKTLGWKWMRGIRAGIIRARARRRKA